MKTLSFKTAVVASIAVLCFNISLSAQSKYKVDASKSTIVWLAKKVTGEHSGTVALSSGDFTLDKSKNLTEGKFEMDMTTIANKDITNDGMKAKLEGHLKSEDFFSVVKFPKSSFEITSPSKLEKGNILVKGKLTIKGITNPLEFKAVLYSTNDGMRINANITIDRTKYDVRYGSGSFFENLGDKTIYDDFQITLNLLAKAE
jgi:polyisoprenoid-binding protein YceI